NVVVRVALQRSLHARATPDPHRIERVLAARAGRAEALERRVVQDLRHDGLANVLRGDGIRGAHVARFEQGIGIAAEGWTRERLWHMRVGSPVPVRQREVVEAGQLPHHSLVHQQVAAMPRQEIPVAVRTLVEARGGAVNISEARPVDRCRPRRLLQHADGVTARTYDRVVQWYAEQRPAKLRLRLGEGHDARHVGGDDAAGDDAALQHYV